MLKLVKTKQLSFEKILIVFLIIFSTFFNQILLSKKPLFQQLNNFFYDQESNITTKPVDKNIVIIAIDDNSLKLLGRWPWPRATHARLINRLTMAKVSAIGMDILFMEPDLVHPEGDKLLATAIRRNGRTVLPVLTNTDEIETTISKPLTQIADAAAQLAHVNLDFDSQGVARHLQLYLTLHDHSQLPAMSVALSNLVKNSIVPYRIDNQTTIPINFSGPPGYFQYLSYVDVLQNDGVLKSLSGKVVLVGLTAAGLGSNISTPVSNKNLLMPGIEIQANALSTLLSNKITSPVNWFIYILLSLFFISTPIKLFHYFKPSLLILGFAILAIVCSIVLLSYFFLWFSPLPTLVCLIISYGFWTWKRTEKLKLSLFNEHEKASATLTAMAEAVITTDQQGYIEFINPAAEKMLASTSVEAKKKYFSDICQVIEDSDSTLLGAGTLTVEKKQANTQIIRNKKGKEYTVHIARSPVFARNKQQIGTVLVINNLTDIINVNRKIAFIASHDALTGLPNRILFQDRLEQALFMAKRKSLNFAILFIDLDGFKKINDGIGHSAGDLVLQEVATRLRNITRKSDTISRWGGDEFVIILENLASNTSPADIAIKIIQTLSFPIAVNKQNVFATPSIGISLFPDDGDQANVLLAKSDTAMYNVKKNSRNGFCFYSQKLETQAKEKLILETELRNAIALDEFEMYYQPQIDMVSGKIIGSEALIRWNHPNKGFISPNDFIPLAEDSGLIIPIGEWVIRNVCLQLKTWKKLNYVLHTVAINLSTQHLLKKNLIDFINHEINKNGLNPKLLQVEITESMMIEDTNQVIETLDALTTAGISIAIDDFGTGYSSFEYLKRFPIEKLKIDKSFIDNVLHNPDDACIVQAVIALGHKMNMHIIAEGIENTSQATFLKEHLCDYGQGYLYSKPISAKKMGDLISGAK
ncbi:MAG: EAL domain-containing protein [Methylococcales bacterium]